MAKLQKKKDLVTDDDLISMDLDLSPEADAEEARVQMSRSVEEFLKGFGAKKTDPLSEKIVPGLKILRALKRIAKEGTIVAEEQRRMQDHQHRQEFSHAPGKFQPDELARLDEIAGRHTREGTSPVNPFHVAFEAGLHPSRAVDVAHYLEHAGNHTYQHTQFPDPADRPGRDAYVQWLNDAKQEPQGESIPLGSYEEEGGGDLYNLPK